MKGGLVGLVATGGTIGCRKNEDGQVVPVLTADDLVESAGAEWRGRLQLKTLGTIAGWNMSPQKQLECYAAVERMCEEEEVTGVVVTHGTDTVEETALMLHALHRGDKPVVFAVAMRNMDETGTDGPRNLQDALKVAICPRSRGLGVLLTVNGEIHSVAARNFTKMDASHIDTFKSTCGPVGRVVGDDVRFFPSARGVCSMYRHVGGGVTSMDLEVPIVKTYTGMDDKIMSIIIQHASRGFVVEGTGSGNVPDCAAKIIAQSCASGSIVVVVSRCPQGMLVPAYGTLGGGSSLKRMGVIFGMGLNAQRARVLLMVALASGVSRERIEKIFEGVGEGE